MLCSRFTTEKRSGRACWLV